MVPLWELEKGSPLTQGLMRDVWAKSQPPFTPSAWCHLGEPFVEGTTYITNTAALAPGTEDALHLGGKGDGLI